MSGSAGEDWMAEMEGVGELHREKQVTLIR